MKRSRALEPNTSTPSLPQKAHKKPKEPINPKSRSRKPGNGAAVPGAHHREAKEGHEEERPAADGCYASWEVVDVGLGFGEGEGFGLWCGSVEEEVLLGWFPWAGPVWGEDEEEVGREYGDIWQLQHIHEIPAAHK